MRRTALLALLSHWRRHPFQLLTLVLGLALATGLWSGVQAINAEARASYDRAASALGSDRPVLQAVTGTIPEPVYIAMRRAGWKVTPVVDGWIDAGEGRVRLLGIDPLTAPPDFAPVGGLDGGAAADPLGFLVPPGRLIASPDTARRLTAEGLPPVIVSDAAAPGIVLADIGIAQRILGLEGQLSRLILVEEGGATLGNPEDFMDELALHAPQGSAGLQRLTDSFHLNLTAFGFLSFAVGLLIVHGAIGLAFEQRRPMFRTLRALGLPARTLTGLVGAELVSLAVVSGLLGIVLGYVVAAALIPDVAATLRGLYGVPVEGGLSLRPAWWAAGIGIALLGTLVAGMGTIWKIARLPVLAQARPRAWARADARLAWAQGAGAALLALVALGAKAFGEGLAGGFTLLAALLLSAALALPLALTALFGLTAKLARGARAEWFWADTRQQLPSLSLALMALLLALAANIGVSTMVYSFRLTFNGWLDQRLVSDLYVTATDAAEAERLSTWIAPRPDTLLPIWHVGGEILGRPAEVYGVADNPVYPANWPMLEALPDAWDRIRRGEGALVNEQLARREGLHPGDGLTLPGGAVMEIAGVYSDYGNPSSQVAIGLPRLVALYPGVERLRFGILTGTPRELARALTEELGMAEGQISDQASIKAFSRDVFERTFAVTDALNVLTLAVAGFAILTSLLTLGAMRLPQLAPVWALGLPRRQLARLELLRTLALAGFTFLLALPLGLALAWVLLTVINVEAFGWRLPMYLFPAEWLRLALFALIAAALAGLWPAFRLTRLAPATLLRIFSNER